MAEINLGSHARGKKGIVRRAKKLSTRVDLTAMVDLGFLLITFFIVTTTWSKSRALNFKLPADGNTDVPQSTALTIIPLGNDSIFYYHGMFSDAIKYHQFGICDYSFQNGIGNVIRQKQISLDAKKEFKNGRKDMFVTIKPSPASSLRDMTRIFDEMLINVVGTYALTDLSDEEKKFLSAQHIPVR